MAVAFEDSSHGSAEGASSVSSGNVTPATGNYLSVAFGITGSSSSSTVSSFNINETGATEVSGSNQSASGSGLDVEIWSYYATGVSGSHDADFTVGATVNDIFCGLQTLSGVDQTTPIDNVSGASGAFSPTDTLGTSATSATDDMVIDCVGIDAYVSPSMPGSGHDTANVVTNTTSGESGMFMGYEAGAATQTIGYDHPGTSAFAYAYMNVNADAGGGPSGPDTPQGLQWIHRGFGPQRSSSLGGELQ